MLRVTKDIKLPTTITGSLPRPSWFTENLGSRDFMFAMVDTTYREQYLDAVMVYLKEQELAGLDILTDGDAHFDNDVAARAGPTTPPAT
jgi:5-methyltetrahydropteroyltriglutamate--homocysteine methyltransferase